MLERGIDSLPDHAWKKLMAWKANDPLRITIHDEPNVRISDIRKQAKQAERRYGHLGGIVVDYIQLIVDPRERVPRHEKVGDITRALKMMATEFDCPDPKTPKPHIVFARENSNLKLL